MSKEQINRKIEKTLAATIENLEEERRVKNKTKQSKKLLDAKFILGQFYFEFVNFKCIFNLKIKNFDSFKKNLLKGTFRRSLLSFRHNKRRALFSIVSTRCNFVR
jgi:hypothetical protein